MKIFAAGLLLILCMKASFAETRDAEKHFFDMKLGDFQSELATAKQEGKTGIMVMFEQEGCPYCLRMKNTILSQSEVQDYYRQHFLLFTIDIRGSIPMQDFSGRETTEKAFSAENEVYGTPAFDFFDLNGKLITRFSGSAKNANEFLLLGRCVAEGACKKTSFTAYKTKMAK
jgi:thioredoxin-related protein